MVTVAATVLTRTRSKSGSWEHWLPHCPTAPGSEEEKAFSETISTVCCARAAFYKDWKVRFKGPSQQELTLNTRAWKATHMPNCRALSPHYRCHRSTVPSSRPVGPNMERKLKRWRKGPRFDMGALRASCPHTAGQCFLTGFLKPSPDCEHFP